VRFCPIKQNSSSQLRRGLRGLIDCQKFALSVGLRSRNPTPATVSLGYAVALAFAQRVLCTQPCPEGFTQIYGKMKVLRVLSVNQVQGVG